VTVIEIAVLPAALCYGPS